MFRTTRPTWAATVAVLATGFASIAHADDGGLAELETRAHDPDATEASTADLERRLTTSASVTDVLALVRAKSPSLRAARARVRATLRSVASSTRLPDPVLKGELWGVPLDAPYALNRADTLMLGVKQELPLSTFASSKRDVAEADAAVAGATLTMMERDAERDVRAAFVRYQLAFEERALHIEHVRITEATIEALRGAQAAGHANEADVSNAQVALTMAHSDLYALDADEAAARATLNAWMGCAAEAPLGPPAVDSVAALRPQDALPLDANDAVLRAEAESTMAEATARAAKDDALLPTLMAGVDYWYMPTAPDPHAYGAMVSVSLPWLNLGRSGDVDAADQRSVAARAELEAARLDVERNIVDANARVASLEKQLENIEREELPATEHNVEATKAAFAAGTADARAVLASNAMLLDARMRRARAQAELALARIDLARLTSSFDRGAP